MLRKARPPKAQSPASYLLVPAHLRGWATMMRQPISPPPLPGEYVPDPPAHGFTRYTPAPVHHQGHALAIVRLVTGRSTTDLLTAYSGEEIERLHDAALVRLGVQCCGGGVL